MPQTITNIPSFLCRFYHRHEFYCHFLSFILRGNDSFGFGRAPTASQKALSKSKGPFFLQNECAKWCQNFRTFKNLRRKLGIFVIVCGICWSMDKKQTSKCQYRPKTTQMLNKNKACAMLFLQKSASSETKLILVKANPSIIDLITINNSKLCLLNPLQIQPVQCIVK